MFRSIGYEKVTILWLIYCWVILIFNNGVTKLKSFRMFTSFELEEMLMGHTDGLSEPRSSKERLLPYAESEVDDDDSADSTERILYSASFEELAKNIVKYDTVIWLSISLLLVLAWGVGIVMLLYLPFKRYVLQKDILSRTLYVTASEIVYKVQTYMLLD